MGNLGGSVQSKTIEDAKRFLASLKQTERLDAGDLQAYQRRLLERVVRHARAQTDYYCDALAVLFDADGTIDWGRWAEVPILTREAAQANPEALYARSIPEPVGKPTEIRTSGSTGRVMPILWDQLAGFAGQMLDARFYEWHGIDTAGSLAIIKSFADGGKAFPDGARSRGWHLFGPNAGLFELNSATGFEQQIEWLERRRPDYLASYPNNILELARTLGAARARRLGLKALMPFGETVSEDARAEIEEIFAIPLLDRYGSTEVGQISAQCPMSLRHHVSMENVFLEILDDDNKPVKPGEQGRVVVTGLYNYSMPFIRYEQADYAILSPDACPCGRSLTSIERIVGRARSVFRFNDGSSRFPYLKPREIMPFLPHRQIQVAQTHLDRVEIRYVPDPSCDTIDLEGLARFIHERLHPSLKVETRAMESIPRAPGGKYFDYVSEIGQN
jgi:phenylacetate-CoA ligase